MEGKEQLLEALKNIDVKELAEPRPVFGEEEYKMFKQAGLSAEEIKSLEETEMTRQIIELLPDSEEDMKKLEGALKAVSNADVKANTANLLLIAQKDPERLVQLLALTEVLEKNN